MAVVRGMGVPVITSRSGVRFDLSASLSAAEIWLSESWLLEVPEVGVFKFWTVRSSWPSLKPVL